MLVGQHGAGLAHSWRIAPDCDEWANVYVAARTNEPLARFAGRRVGAGQGSGYNDPDMLVGSNPAAPAPARTHRKLMSQHHARVQTNTHARTHTQ